MSKTQNVYGTDKNREKSRLECDDPFHCKKCGVSLPWQVVIIGEYQRCRQCEKEELLRQFRLDYPVEWDHLNPQEVATEKTEQEDEHGE